MPPESSQEPDEERTRGAQAPEGDAPEDEAPQGDAPEDEAPEDRPGEPGAEGGSRSPTRDKLPGMPAKDDPSPVGDTDQHSKG